MGFEISSKAGKIGGKRTSDTGFFQTQEWKTLASRAEYIWFTDGKRNKRIHFNKVETFKEKNINWIEGITRENHKYPDNSGKVYLYSPDWKIKRFIKPNSEIHEELIKNGYQRK